MTGQLSQLEEAECYRLLASRAFGRLVATADALPLVVPVNFALDGRAIVLRTAPESLIARATNGAVVAFEVDDIDPVSRSGWSVVVTGVARPVREEGERLRAAQLKLVTWVAGDRDHFVRISPGMVTGRFLSPSARARPQCGPDGEPLARGGAAPWGKLVGGGVEGWSQRP